MNISEINRIFRGFAGENKSRWYFTTLRSSASSKHRTEAKITFNTSYRTSQNAILF